MNALTLLLDSIVEYKRIHGENPTKVTLSIRYWDEMQSQLNFHHMDDTGFNPLTNSVYGLAATIVTTENTLEIT